VSLLCNEEEEEVDDDNKQREVADKNNWWCEKKSDDVSINSTLTPPLFGYLLFCVHSPLSLSSIYMYDAYCDMYDAYCAFYLSLISPLLFSSTFILPSLFFFVFSLPSCCLPLPPPPLPLPWGIFSFEIFVFAAWVLVCLIVCVCVLAFMCFPTLHRHFLPLSSPYNPLPPHLISRKIGSFFLYMT